MVGNSVEFHAVQAAIRKFAAVDAPVLIEGETGTGKELVARAIHYSGGRSAGPFIPVNCGALPDQLIVNELFGHQRGAFTDARDDQPGLVALAHTGTLFLDEIDALSLKGQVTLLRFLQDQQYRPLGARRTQQADTRVIAASNRDLERQVAQGEFRLDLLHRLKLLHLTLPPLRERPDDILPLARHFVQRFAQQYGRPQQALDRVSEQALLEHAWPGNVRELENLIHREFLMGDTPDLHLASLLSERPEAGNAIPAAAVPFELGFARAKATVVAAFEKAFVIRALAQTGGNVSRAARIVGKERRAFGKLLKKHGVDRARNDHDGIG
jgi:two-component system, NtrC family, response regulator GlrR